MEPWRTILLWATIVGALLAAGGLTWAYLSAKQEYEASGERVEAMRELMKRMSEDSNPSEESYQAFLDKHDLEYPSWGNLVLLALFESRRLVRNIAVGARTQLAVAGVGLLLSTFASAASLYLATA